MSKPHAWLAEIVESAHARALAKAALRPSGGVADGSRGSSSAIMAGTLSIHCQRPVLMVVAHLDEADDAVDDLVLFNEAGYDINPMRFGALEVLPGESGVNLELMAERLSVVESLSRKQLHNTVIVAPVQALMQGVPKPESASQFTLTLHDNQTFPPGALLDWLDRAGYSRQDAIEQIGDFAVRGGIIDLYPPAGSVVDSQGNTAPIGPIRLDYFGDEIETLSRIDSGMMGTGQPLQSVSLIGANSVAIQANNDNACLIDLLPENTLPVLHEAMELSEQARGYFERLTDAKGIYAPKTIFKKMLDRPHLEINQYSTATGTSREHSVALPLVPLPAFDTDAKSAITELAQLGTESRVTVVCRQNAEAKRLQELLGEIESDTDTQITIEVGGLHRGFVWQDESPIALIPHHELFHRFDAGRRVRKIISPSNDAGKAVSDAFLDLEVGDYVVHVDHGIAVFAGLRTMRREGRSEEYLTLEFDDNAKLHVPAAQIDLIQKYIGGFAGRPPLSKLGGKRWQKQKDSVAEAVKDLAAELLRIQAARQTQPGIRFPADTTWQKEFEAEFPFEETEDQLSAIAAVKRDMSENRPMDRLICGDVGFGKTEVAIRAAFKAAEFGKQVAVLVPTTVLAEQHERSFRARLADYPFTVASMSRFKTGKQQKTTLEKVANGQVDILIGTHRILSQDVKFADLGLVIIDEEQRFGVEHKNKLLSFRMTADVLTLSATPIPRTLHMSMIGLRDLSLIHI